MKVETGGGRAVREYLQVRLAVQSKDRVVMGEQQVLLRAVGQLAGTRCDQRVAIFAGAAERGLCQRGALLITSAPFQAFALLHTAHLVRCQLLALIANTFATFDGLFAFEFTF